MLYDYTGTPSGTPYWYNCSGSNYTLLIQSPDNIGNWTIDWGDGSPTESGAILVPPQSVSHIYVATVDTFIVTFTDLSTGCVITGIIVIEESSSASIQIPIGGLTQACAPQDMDFINSSTNVSENTIFTWDFGDGSPVQVYDYTNWGQVLTHTYQQGTVSCETVVTLSAENYCNTLQGGPSTATFNPIRVWDLDTAQITPSATLLCYPDTTVTFLNTSIRNCYNQGNIYQRFEYWNFGDYWGLGYDSIIDWTPWPPTFPHTIAYPGIGTYQVQLQDSNFCGIDTALVTINIVPPPSVTLTVNPDTICVGETAFFTQTTNGGANYFEWNFGDGSGYQWMGAGDQSHTYNTPGDYTIYYAASIQGATSGCADTASISVHVLPSPTAIIIADTVAACDDITVTFTDGSVDALSWSWDFDNGNTSNAQNPPQQFYGTPGQYDVTLTVINSNLCTHTATQVISVFESPVVSFTGSNVCEGEFAQFTDNSIVSPGDSIIVFDWTFGDGGIDSIQDPIHTYSISGTYWVTLEIFTMTCSAIDSIQVNVEQVPTAAIVPSTIIGCTPLTVDFTNNSVGGVTYLWDMADGSTSNLFEPTDVFVNNTAIDTTYTVAMVVYTTFGCTDTAFVDITVTPAAIADFINDAQPGCAPVTVNFTNQSIAASSYFWDLGDGTTTTVIDPTNLYVNNTAFLETYDIMLVAISAFGCTDTMYQQITVYPTADFTFTSQPDSGCSPLSVTFPAVAGAVDYQWAYGDGTFGTGPSPTHIYYNSTSSNQTFIVQLIATNAFGCVDTNYADVTVLPDPTADFSLSEIDGCHPLTVELTNQSSGAVNYTWIYGDGTTSDTLVGIHEHTFFNFNVTTPVLYDITLIAVTNAGCTDSISQQVEVYPAVIAQVFSNNIGCSPLTVDFNNISQGATAYFWDFDDAVTSYDFEPTHTFVNTSLADTVFNVMMVATSSYACNDTTYLPITVHPMPTAQFTQNDFAGCQPLVLGLNNYTFGAATIYWNYGDGTFSTTDSSYHEHIYINNTGAAQTYNIELIATTAGGCTDTAFGSVTVYPSIISSFDSDTAGCSPITLDFINTSSGAVSYVWDMGDGTTLIDVDPTYTYQNNTANDITYNVQLIALSAFGCTDTSFINVHVYAVPMAAFVATPPTQQFPNSTVDIFNLTSAGNWNYSWDFGDGNIDQGQNPAPHTYGTWGIYNIQLIASSTYCSDTAMQQIVIDPPQPVADFLGSGIGCAPLTVDFTNTSYGGLYFNWSFGDGGTSQTESPSHTYDQPGTYTISLTVTGVGNGTMTVVHIDSVVIYPRANAFFVLNPSSVVVPNEAVYFYNLSSSADSYLWDFGDGNSTTEVNPIYYYSAPGEYDVTLIANNQWNCPDTFSLPNAVFAEASGTIDFPNAFTPNSSSSSDGRYDPYSVANDFFFPLYAGVEEYHLMIFNRWGELIFESFDVEIGWDGFYRGQPAKQDVYVWKCRAKFSDGNDFLEAGDLTLLR